jgi:hypothetical protein
VDADAEHNKVFATAYKVDSFPTIKFFPRMGSPWAKQPPEGDEIANQVYEKFGKRKHPIDFDKLRSDKEFTRFLNKYCGTSRAVAGGLNEKAGRILKWDKLAAEFMEYANKAEGIDPKADARNKKGNKKSKKKGDKKEGEIVDPEAKVKLVEVIKGMKEEMKNVRRDQQFSADWYLRIAEKISSRGTPWLRKEIKRQVFLSL